jgi:eukaryotic-like serine/threonine-protein kinase
VTARDPGARPADAAAFRERVRAVYANLSDAALNLGTPNSADRMAATLPLQGSPARPNPTQILSQAPVASEPPPPARIKPRSSPREGYVVQEQKRRRSRKGLIIFLLVLILAAAAGIGAWLYGQTAFQNTPNLVGLPQSQATATLADDGLRYLIVDTFSSSVAAGDVVSLSPGPGTPVKQGAVITLTVSKGEPAAPVPDVTGQSQDDATSALQQHGFKVAIAAAQTASSTVAKGSVVSYTPTGSAPPASTITLTISSGPQQVVVRDVTGMSVEDATAALQAQGFTVTTTRLLPFVDDVGRQSPNGGTSADYGSTITLYIF